jgi:glycosyltransferase A (GT-A) superfamily protein (DUF2064 family)
MSAVQVLVLAKEPVAGRVKTRLTPALTPQQAAEVATAALQDTLDAVRRTDAAVRVLVVDGSWDAPGFVRQPQSGGALDERLALAFDDAWAARALPMVLIGMDTPQVTEVLLEKAIGMLLSPGVDAVLGLAEDGGWWALGLRSPQAHLIRGTATSRDDTGQVQQDRLLGAGLAVVDLPVLRDVDTVEDLHAVARVCPGGRFAAVVERLLP